MITVELTPNPETLKFFAKRDIAPHGPFSFQNSEAAENVPLVEILFTIDGVASVFLGKDFISVTKASEISWDDLRAPILTALKDFFAKGNDIFAHKTEAPSRSEMSEVAPQNDIERQICALLDERIRPFVAQDGGDIVFERFEEGVVYLKMHGACSGCPSATATLKQGVENLLKHFIPGVERVEPV